jgi:hypothetical protein
LALTRSCTGHTGDFLAAVGNLADRLGSTGHDLEVLARNNDVVAVVAARDLAAISAVAQSLCKSQQTIQRLSRALWARWACAYRHGGLPRVFDLDITAETASGRHDGVVGACANTITEQRKSDFQILVDILFRGNYFKRYTESLSSNNPHLYT